MVDGARSATGTAVIIDVFRAATVEAYLMRRQIKDLIPVGDMQLAYDFKRRDKSCVLVGERNGVMLPGFDYGNSPSEVENAPLCGKTVIHTTSAGTQGMANAVNAEEVLVGSLVTAGAVARYIKQSGKEEISLVCMGLMAKEQTAEDNLCAEYIKSLLLDKPIDISGDIECLKTTSGAKFFDESKQNVYPQRDFYLCTEVNKFNFVLKLENGADGLAHIRQIPIGR